VSEESTHFVGRGLAEDWERYDLLTKIPGSDWLTPRPHGLERVHGIGRRARSDGRIRNLRQ
jgi:hypothetical protein